VLRRNLIFVAREEGQAAGYVALGSAEGGAIVVVEQLFVAPGHERRGIGHRLLAYAEGYAIAEPDTAMRYFGIPATIIESHTRWSRRPVYGYRYVKRRGHQVRVRMLVAFVKMSHTFQTTSPNEYFTNVARYNIMFHNGLPANYLGGTC
jgi:GNAT superfamily N-acetyltransferase